MKLGERLDVVALTLKGETNAPCAIELVDNIVDVLCMKKVHKPTWYHYPVNDAGGLGFTYIQPIAESFIAWDSWSDFKGGYLIMCSCRTINLNKVSARIRKLGYRIKQIKANELNLGRANAL